MPKFPKPRPKASNVRSNQAPKRAVRGAEHRPLWAGPYQEGITFSLLSKFLVCRERFRLRVVEGLREQHAFDHTLEYGSMWHAAEEALAGGNDWVKAVKQYANKLLEQHAGQDREIGKWRDICLLVFPLYIQYWKRHPITTNRKKVLEEVGFRVPYTLPSGRTIVLRGKYDAVYRVDNRLSIQENKSKGKIDEEGIQATVSQNLQSMFYQIALRRSLIPITGQGQYAGVRFLDTCESLRKSKWDGPDDARGYINLPSTKGNKPYQIAGVLYNVVRRPLADRYAIKQRIGRGKSKDGAESDQQFYRRVAETVKGDLKYHFFRWEVTLTDKDINIFRQRVFDPIMEQLCDWWDSITAYDPWNPWFTFQPGLGLNLMPNKLHWQAPWGVYNGMYDGYRGDYFELLAKGRKHNVETVTELFPELQ